MLYCVCLQVSLSMQTFVKRYKRRLAFAQSLYIVMCVCVCVCVLSYSYSWEVTFMHDWCYDDVESWEVSQVACEMHFFTSSQLAKKLNLHPMRTSTPAPPADDDDDNDATVER